MGGEFPLNKDDIQLRFCKYKITKFDLIIPGEEEPFTIDEAHMGNWSIEKDYEGYYFPYFEMRCMVPDAIYRKIMDSSENVYVDLKIEYAYFEDTTEIDPAAMLYTYDKLLEDRFYAFIANKSPKMTDVLLGEADKDADNEPNEYTQYSYDNNKPLVMGLYRVKHIFNTNQIVNKILSGCSATDAVVWILNQISAERVIMSPSTSSKIYDQLVIPPVLAPKGIMHIVNTYNLYKDGAIVFFDYDRIFVIDKRLGCNAYSSGEHPTVYLTSFPATSNQSVMKSGYYFNNEEKYLVINIIGNSISISNDSLFNDYLVGGNIVAIDSNTGEITHLQSEVSVADDSLSKQGITNRVIVQDRGSTDTLESAKTEIEQSQSVINIVAENINIQALEPNKDFIFTTDNVNYQKYQGHYRMTNMSAIFTKESQFYTCMCTATFVGGKKDL